MSLFATNILNIHKTDWVHVGDWTGLCLIIQIKEKWFDKIAKIGMLDWDYVRWKIDYC